MFLNKSPPKIAPVGNGNVSLIAFMGSHTVYIFQTHFMAFSFCSPLFVSSAEIEEQRMFELVSSLPYIFIKNLNMQIKNYLCEFPIYVSILAK